MRILSKEIISKGAKFSFARHRLETKSGVRLEREFIDHPGSVLLIPVLPDKRVVMVRLFRHAVGERLLELPAGTCAGNEPFEETARRELAEETGYVAGRLEKLFEVYALPGATNERMAYYLADGLSPGPTDREEDEDMEVEIHSLADLLEMIRSGKIVDAKTVIGLLSLARR